MLNSRNSNARIIFTCAHVLQVLYGGITVGTAAVAGTSRFCCRCCTRRTLNGSISYFFTIIINSTCLVFLLCPASPSLFSFFFFSPLCCLAAASSLYALCINTLIQFNLFYFNLFFVFIGKFVERLQQLFTVFFRTRNYILNDSEENSLAQLGSYVLFPAFVIE